MNITNENHEGSHLEDVNLKGLKAHNITLEDAEISAVNLGGATFKHIGPPPHLGVKQKPVRFQDGDLNGSVFENVNLRGVEIKGCDVEGMRINGILVSELLEGK